MLEGVFVGRYILVYCLGEFEAKLLGESIALAEGACAFRNSGRKVKVGGDAYTRAKRGLEGEVGGSSVFRRARNVEHLAEAALVGSVFSFREKR